MCKEISLLQSQIPDCLIEKYNLSRFTHTRGAEPEIWFTYHDSGHLPNMIPVIHNGQLCIYEWGNRSANRCKLPTTWYCKQEDLESGLWTWARPQHVIVPANFANEHGIWYDVIQGIKAIVVNDPNRNPHVYLIDQPASHYYEVMTRAARMPVLVEQKI